MKILYGIQGTGHGHISRAREILPLLSSEADLDIVLSGYNHRMNLHGYHTIQKKGISLQYDSRGGVSIMGTALHLRPFRFLQDVKSLQPDQYDLIISDFEPVTSWAAISSGIPCIGLSHQASFISDNTPRPDKRSGFAEQVLRYFAPCTIPVGFHFQRYDTFIDPPIIRSQIKELNSVQGNYVTVYLPAFDHETLVSIFRQLPEVRWEIFSTSCSSEYSHYNCKVKPIGNETFIKSLESCLGVLTSSGFETCSEAMYLGKKLAVIPIKNQYEQLCNAAALHKMGVTVITDLQPGITHQLQTWLNDSPVISLPEIADTKRLTDRLLSMSQLNQTNSYS
jgi:uncharacterized protein (TIGR00661 family)